MQWNTIYYSGDLKRRRCISAIQVEIKLFVSDSGVQRCLVYSVNFGHFHCALLLYASDSQSFLYQGPLSVDSQPTADHLPLPFKYQNVGLII